LRGQHTHGQNCWPNCLIRRNAFELVDLDAFGCPSALLPWPSMRSASADALCGRSDGRSPNRPATGPRSSAAGGLPPGPIQQAGSWPAPAAGGDRPTAWAMGSGLEPLLSFVRAHLRRGAPAAPLPRRRRGKLGMDGYCHAAGTSRCTAVSLRRLGAMARADRPLAVSGHSGRPLLQHRPHLTAMAQLIPSLGAKPRLLARLGRRRRPASRCWPTPRSASDWAVWPHGTGPRC